MDKFLIVVAVVAAIAVVAGVVVVLWVGLDKSLAKVFGTKHEREIKAIRPIVAAINELEPQMKELSDEELAAQTVMFREQFAQGATLDDLLIPAFATVREAGRRVLNMRHFDVQLIGGIVLHRGKIAEMKTGEGKTLVATLPVYLNALAGKGVHVVTVNDYLARRDSDWMGKIYKGLGHNPFWEDPKDVASRINDFLTEP